MGKKSGGFKNVGANITPASQDQKDAQGLLTNFSNYSTPQALKLTQMGVDDLTNNQFTSPNWDSLYNTTSGRVGSAQTKISDLANGKLSDEYQKNRDTVLRSSVENSLGSSLNRYSKNGVINSSVLNSFNDNLDKNTQLTAAKMYNQDLSTASDLANKELSTAGANIDLANKTGEASLAKGSSLLSLGRGMLAPTQDLWARLLAQQTSLSSPAQTVYQQGSGGVLNGLLSGAASFYK